MRIGVADAALAGSLLRELLSSDAGAEDCRDLNLELIGCLIPM